MLIEKLECGLGAEILIVSLSLWLISTTLSCLTSLPCESLPCELFGCLAIQIAMVRSSRFLLPDPPLASNEARGMPLLGPYGQVLAAGELFLASIFGFCFALFHFVLLGRVCFGWLSTGSE